MNFSTLKVVALSVALGPFAGTANAGEDDLVGVKITNDMKIAFYMEAPKHGMVMTSGKSMMVMDKKPTHHPEVKVFDTESGKFIPYLDVSVRFENQSTGAKMDVPLPAMLGGWFHYGRNAMLPEKGSYQVTINVVPQELMRYKSMEKKWANPASVSFDYTWK